MIKLDIGMLKNVIILLLIGYVIYDNIFEKEDVISIDRVILKTDTIYSDTGKVVIKHVPKIQTIVKENYIEKYINVDTAKILQDYYTYRYYDDTLDTVECIVNIRDTIYANAIISRNVSISNKRATVVNTYTQVMSEKRLKGYIGINGGMLINDVSYGIGLGFQDKNDNIYGLDIINNKQGISYLGTLKFKIKFKK